MAFIVSIKPNLAQSYSDNDASQYLIDLMPKNLKEARRWYSKVASCAIKDIAQAARDEAAAWVRDHPA